MSNYKMVLWAYEVLNAVTMLPSPLILLLHASITRPYSVVAFVVIAAQVPFSMAYHLREAYRLYTSEEGCRIDNHWRRLDQTTQHMAQLGLTYAITQSWPYTAMALLWHCEAWRQLWDPITSNDRKRWQMIGFGVLLYTAPIAIVDVALGVYATIPMLVGGCLAFIPQFRFEGSHAVMHALAWMHADAVGYFLHS